MCSAQEVAVYRRVVSLLLLPSLLLSHAAAFGHTHGDDTPAGHDQRPHVHVRLPAGHAHGHHHRGPGGHHHYHDDDETAPAVPPPPDPLSDHDADAVFVSTDAAVVERPVTVGTAEVAALWIVPEAGVSAGGSLIALVCPAGNGRPPPRPACPLYVRHLALLM